MFRFSFLVLIALSATVISAQKYPIIEVPETVDEEGVSWIGPIRRCDIEATDPELDDCTAQIKADLTPKVGSGIPEIGLRPLDPYFLSKFDYDNKVGPVTIKIAARDVKMEGLAQYKTLNFKVDTRKKKMFLEYETPMVRIESFYKAGGDAVLFPITGSGPASIKISNLRTMGVMDYKIVVREDGKEVVQLENCILKDMKIGGMAMRVSGLFPGNRLMSAMVHYFANTYGSQVFEFFLKEEIAKFAGEVIARDILNPVLYNLPHLPAYLKE